MNNLHFCLYLVNAVLIIIHEIDSAYWQEWKLFKIPGGINTFLLLHIPLLFIILYGVIAVYENTKLGTTISLLLAMGGIFAFLIHAYFIKKGHQEFKSLISQIILFFTLLISIAQIFFIMQ